MTERDTAARQAGFVSPDLDVKTSSEDAPAPLSISPAPATGETPMARARVHAITLCCAHSVEELVHEVARNLEGLGFETRVASGAEAREALRGRDREQARPTIYVVCVQGQLRETVLKPLRQALADQGGPNEHLFVAVLDTALPLAMVGQIRRFADTLELGQRRPRRGKELEPKELSERRQWREEMGGDHRFRTETQRYRALRVETGRQEPIRVPEEVRDEGGRKAARVSGTSKYRAIALATTSEDADGREPAREEVAPAANDADDPTPGVSESPAAGRSSTRLLAVPGVETKSVGREARVLRTQASRPPAARPLPAVPLRSASASRVFSAIGIGIAVVVVVTFGWLGATRRIGGKPEANVRVAGLAAENQARADADAPSPSEAAHVGEAVVDPAVQGGDGETAGQAAQDDGAAAPSPTDGDPEASPERAEAIPPAPPDLGRFVEAELGRALISSLERRSVLETQELYLTPRQGEATDWHEARRRCITLREGNVSRWRLPYRRELRLLGAIGRLQSGQYWSSTADKAEPELATVYDATTQTLATASKTETTADVVCVLRKDELSTGPASG